MSYIHKNTTTDNSQYISINEHSERPTWQKYLFIILGSLCVILGIIGVFLPILPTTPFLLLASFLFFRSSKKLHDQLLKNKILGSYIYNYTTYKAIPKKVKISAILLLWLSITVSIILISILWLRILLLVIAIGVSIHLAKLNIL